MPSAELRAARAAANAGGPADSLAEPSLLGAAAAAVAATQEPHPGGSSRPEASSAASPGNAAAGDREGDAAARSAELGRPGEVLRARFVRELLRDTLLEWDSD